MQEAVLETLFHVSSRLFVSSFVVHSFVVHSFVVRSFVVRRGADRWMDGLSRTRMDSRLLCSRVLRGTDFELELKLAPVFFFSADGFWEDFGGSWGFLGCFEGSFFHACFWSGL